MVATTVGGWGPLTYSVTSATWYHVAISWSAVNGLYLYVNGAFISNAPYQQRPQSVPTSQYNAFVIGRANNDLATQGGGFILDELYFFNSYLGLDFVTLLYGSYGKMELYKRTGHPGSHYWDYYPGVLSLTVATNLKIGSP